MKAFLKKWVPPILVDTWHQRGKKKREPVRFTGDYASWEAALHDSVGYDSDAIFERTRNALRKVRDGEVTFERDSVLLETPELPLPLIAALLHVAMTRGGKLTVVDFGGSLGSSYFQCRPLLSPLSVVNWIVVEQPKHVKCGRAEFTTAELCFFDSLDEALEQNPTVDLILLSSVLQYLPAPHQFLERVSMAQVPFIFIDRTAFHSNPQDRLTVQTIPDWIYPASYPAWFFSEEKITAHFGLYELLASFPSIDQPQLSGSHAYTKGFFLRRR